jgi:hypothetical protein
MFILALGCNEEHVQSKGICRDRGVLYLFCMSKMCSCIRTRIGVLMQVLYLESNLIFPKKARSLLIYIVSSVPKATLERTDPQLVMSWLGLKPLIS